jgi:nucleoside-diphosphate-sugar epimerase
LTPKHVAIAGNMGYVGPAVVRHLRQAFPTARLTGFDTGYFAHCLTGAPTLPEAQLDVQRFIDVRSITADLLDGVDAVVNLAAISNDPMGKAFEEATHAINYEAGIRLASLAKQAGVKSFVFASSCSVYGFAEGGPRRESDPLHPLTAYARSKIASESGLKAIAGDDFTVTCLRFPTACGMSDRLRLDLVLNDFVASAIAAQRIDILSDGSPWRPLIDTQDMALAIEWATQRGAHNGGDFVAVNVGRGNRNYQVRELAETVAAEIPGVAIAINKDAAPDQRSYQVDFSLYGKLAPQHLPRFDLRNSIRGLADGLTNMRFADAAFRTSAYIRLRVLEQLKADGRLNAQLEWQRPVRAAISRVA